MDDNIVKPSTTLVLYSSNLHDNCFFCTVKQSTEKTRICFLSTYTLSSRAPAPILFNPYNTTKNTHIFYQYIFFTNK